MAPDRPDAANPLRIDQALLLQLARATRHLRAAWSFTHLPRGPENQAERPFVITFPAPGPRAGAAAINMRKAPR